MFSAKELYSKLEELFVQFEKTPRGAGKYYLFKIELIYYEEEMELPARVKAMEFLHTDIVDDLYPKKIY